MNSKFIQRETAICEYACDRYYIVDYNHYGYVLTVKGLLLNYYNGNIVLLSEDGIYHLKYKDIVFMKPAKVLFDKFSSDFKELIRVLQEDDE